MRVSSRRGSVRLCGKNVNNTMEATVCATPLAMIILISDNNYIILA